AVAGGGEARDDPADRRQGDGGRLPPIESAPVHTSGFRADHRRGVLAAAGFRGTLSPHGRHGIRFPAYNGGMDPSAASRRELSRLAAREPIDLARAALAIAREEYPDLDEARYLRALDDLAAQVMRGLPPGALAERRVGRLTSVLFHELGFSGNAADYYDPRNSYLNKRDLPRALSCVDRLLLFAPDDVRVLRDRARLYEMLGGEQAAAGDLERVLSLDPNASDARTLRARLERLRGSARLLN